MVAGKCAGDDAAVLHYDVPGYGAEINDVKIFVRSIVIEIERLYCVFQIIADRVIIECVLAVVQRAVGNGFIAVYFQRQPVADMRRLDSSDTRNQIVTVRYGFYIITIASEYRSCIALEIERQGGFGFQRESRALKGCALGQVADNRLGYIKGNSSKRLFCFGPLIVCERTGILIKVNL